MCRHIRKERHKYRREYKTSGHKIQRIYRITKYAGEDYNNVAYHGRKVGEWWYWDVKIRTFFITSNHICSDDFAYAFRDICSTSFCSKHSLDITPQAFRLILDTDLQCMLM
jgi:hypothetical protein